MLLEFCFGFNYCRFQGRSFCSSCTKTSQLILQTRVNFKIIFNLTSRDKSRGTSGVRRFRPIDHWNIHALRRRFRTTARALRICTLIRRRRLSGPFAKRAALIALRNPDGAKEIRAEISGPAEPGFGELRGKDAV